MDLVDPIGFLRRIRPHRESHRSLLDRVRLQKLERAFPKPRERRGRRKKRKKIEEDEEEEEEDRGGGEEVDEEDEDDEGSKKKRNKQMNKAKAMMKLFIS